MSSLCSSSPVLKRLSLLFVTFGLLSLSVEPSFAFRPVANRKRAKIPAAASSPLFAANMNKKRKSILPVFSTAAGDSEKENEGWKDRLLKVSNIASILCVIDCTVLPIVTVVLPFLGLAAFTPAQMECLHHFGHQVALYFVIPVGGGAALLNYLSHKRWKLSLPAALGLVLIYAANANGGPLLSQLPHDIAHALHCGTWIHRATNVAGCALLLGSNYKSHQATHEHGDSCSHHHH